MKRKQILALLLSALLMLLTACGVGSKTRITMKWVDTFWAADLATGYSLSVNGELVYREDGEELERVPWKESALAAEYEDPKAAALAMAEIIEGFSSGKSISEEELEEQLAQDGLYRLTLRHMSSEVPPADFYIVKDGLIRDEKDAYLLLTYEEEELEKLLGILRLCFDGLPQ